MGKHYLYRHIRLDKNIPFYIGIGTVEKKRLGSNTESVYFSRAYNMTKRSSIWKKILNSLQEIKDRNENGFYFNLTKPIYVKHN